MKTIRFNPPPEMRFKAPTKEKPKEEKSNAPQKPTKSPMPKCKPPKDDWEIPSFMLKFKPKETVTFYDMEGKPYATFEYEEQ